MTNTKARRLVVGGVTGLLVCVVAIPTGMSLARGDGRVCFTDSACPLSAVNPCVRQPSFALLGRCALPIK